MVRSIEGKHAKYYEAILQLREVADEVVEYVFSEVEKGKVHIAKTTEIKTGIDIYLSDNDFTKSLGRRLQQKFGGKTVVTSSLFGRKDGKEIYRVTVLFRGVPFRKGDTVTYQGEEYNVKGMAKDIFLQHTKTGKKIHVKYKDMKQISV